MTLTGAFIAHETTTQLRSPRFRILAGLYVVACSLAAVLLEIIAGRSTIFIGPAAFWNFTDVAQPLLTALVAVAIAVDGITRERDEGSLPVVSLAPISAAGYVVRRWIALVVVLIPITLLPRLIAYGAAVHHAHSLVSPAGFALGWVIRVLPIVVVFSAPALALGTISGRTILALIFAFLMFTLGQGFANDLLAHTHRTFSDISAMFGLQAESIDELMWTIRGWRGPSMPTEAGYAFAQNFEQVWPVAAIPCAVAALFLGLSSMYLRRTRPDLRPWKVRPDHPVRDLLRLANRIRDEYMPDAGRESIDRIALIGAAILAATIVVLLVRRFDAFAALASERYAAEQRGPAQMSTDITIESARIRGRIDSRGQVSTTAELTLRNNGRTRIAHLGFGLNAALRIVSVHADTGTTRLDRRWERIGIELDPPIAPNAVKRVTFAVAGTPGTYELALEGFHSFQQRYRRFLQAKDAGELSDLSRSELLRDASGVRIVVDAFELMPVPRYTPWTVGTDAVDGAAFTPELIPSSPRLSVDLDIPRQFLAADACGTTSTGTFNSGCTIALQDYMIVAAPFEVTDIAPAMRLAYLPMHAELARTHAPSLASAVRTARESWPGLPLPDRLIFVERPSFPGERFNGDFFQPAAIRVMRSFGAMNLVPELMFIRKTPIETRVIAASLIANSLARQRPIVPEERIFFINFYESVALSRLGGRSSNAVSPGVGGLPDTDPIVSSTNQWRASRLRNVLSDIEYRVGTERLIEGISDFIHARGPGTAKALLDAIGRRGGVNLDRAYTDYFVGHAIPRLTLADVTFARNGDRWTVTGSLKNDGTGEAFCPIVLRTSAGALRQTIRIDSKETVPFSFTTAYEPRTLQLDPDRVCYRFAIIGSVDSVDNRGRS